MQNMRRQPELLSCVSHQTLVTNNNVALQRLTCPAVPGGGFAVSTMLRSLLIGAVIAKPRITACPACSLPRDAPTSATSLPSLLALALLEGAKAASQLLPWPFVTCDPNASRR
jgi:hypothetical protein